MKPTVLLLLFFYGVDKMFCAEDYWSENFDEGKNCKSQELIFSLKSNKSTALQCVSKNGENLTQAFSECKKALSGHLIDMCAQTNVAKGKAGDLLYCQSRQETTCCFHNHSCVVSWEELYKNMKKESLEYLENKNGTLETITKQGYSACYDLGDSFDASKCNAECDRLKGEKFGQDCVKNGGFFKCCIRRDLKYCHSCRFCCTLGMCSKAGSGGTVETTYDENANITLEDGANKLSAKDNFESISHHLFGQNYRCLKPNSDPDPSKWATYYTEKFINALKQEDLDSKDASYPFHKNFLNYEDPEVFQLLTGPDYEKLWKETYSFDFVAKTEKDPEDYDRDNVNKCMEYCLKEETGDYATKCRKKNGIFKCCTSGTELTILEEINTMIAEKKLLPKSSVFNCGKNGSECAFCTVVLACTLKDPLSGGVKIEFKTPLEHPGGGMAMDKSRFSGVIFDKEYNGTRQELSVRDGWCMKLDACQVGMKLEYYSNPILFFKASSTEEYCDLESREINFGTVREKTGKQLVVDLELDESVEDCRKRKILSVRECPADKLKNAPKEVKELNERLAKIASNPGKKKTKRKKSEKTKKGKKEKKKKDKAKKKKKKKHAN